MDVVFLGTPDFAVPVLKALIDKHNVVAVISQPDRPKGRGKKLQPTPVKLTAEENNIPVYQPEKIKDEVFTAFLETIKADVFVAVAYGQILSERILNIPKYGCINVHGSLLPEYRGAAPIQQCILDGRTKTGVTIMYMEKGLDTGDMILKKEIDIAPDDTYGTLHDKMAPLGAKALIEALDMIEKGTVKAEKQNDSLSTYAHMINKEMGHIDWSRSSETIRDLIRGFNPVPGAYTTLNGEVLKIYAADVIQAEDGNIGEIIAVDKKRGFAVKTGDGALLIREIQAKGGKKMDTADYMRGHSIEKGNILM